MTRPAALLALVALAVLPAAAQAAPLGNVAVSTANAITRSTGDAPFSSSVRLVPNLVVVSSDAVSHRATCPPRLAGRPGWKRTRAGASIRCTVRARTRAYALTANYVLWPRRNRSRLTVTVRGI